MESEIIQQLKNIHEILFQQNKIFFDYINKPFYDNFNFYLPLLSFAGSLIVSWIALYIALHSEELRKKQIKSNLKIIGEPLYNKQADNYTVGRITIKNKSKFRAEDVEADVEDLTINGDPRKNFLSCPLNWTHSQLYSQNNNYHPTRNINPYQSVNLDIYRYSPNDLNNKLKLATIVCQDINDFSSLEKGENDITIRLYQDSGQTLKIELKVIWDGESTPAMKLIRFSQLLN